MRKMFLLSCRVVFLLIPALTLYSCSRGRQYDDTRLADRESPIISGWVEVGLGVDSEYVSMNRGSMEDAYDEFVGGLFDEGLKLSGTRWIKPTYGNENLLWTLDPEIGDRRIDQLMESRDEFSPEFYEFTGGKLDIQASTWDYAGYKDSTSGEKALAFQAFVFVCKGSASGISVFYWGEGVAVSPPENQSVKDLLLELSKHCQ